MSGMSKRQGFTLIELMIVIMIITIIGAIAVPRLLATRKSAQDGALTLNLSAVRNAISMYASENGGALPGSAGTKDASQFKLDVEKYLQASFPKCPVRAAPGQEADVLMSTAEPFVGTAAADEGWAFHPERGEFIANFGGFAEVKDAL